MYLNANNTKLTGPISENPTILTQTFVSRKHMEIFNLYFPPQIKTGIAMIGLIMYINLIIIIHYLITNVKIVVEIQDIQYKIQIFYQN